jgi:hypothetical protein
MDKDPDKIPISHTDPHPYFSISGHVYLAGTRSRKEKTSNRLHSEGMVDPATRR